MGHRNRIRSALALAGALAVIGAGGGAAGASTPSSTRPATAGVPQMSASVTQLAFPSTRVSDISPTQLVTFTNTGSADELLSSFVLGGQDPDDFVGFTNCFRTAPARTPTTGTHGPATLAPGASCQVKMSFLPGALGARQGTLSLHDNEPAPPTVTMTGSGTSGYYEASAVGAVYPFGDAQHYGDMSHSHLNAFIVSMAATPDGNGYWLLGADGGIFSYGDATFFGSTGSMHLNAPVVTMAATPDGGGYWLVAGDGGIFSFGDATFFGSTGSKHLNAPIVGMAPTPDGGGYWLVASDGGIFAFGDAPFFGSTGAKHLNAPIVGMVPTPDGGGYWLVASDGGIFAFGDAAFHGSAGSLHLARPIVGMAATSDGGGYWLVASDGGVFNYGDAPFYGSIGGSSVKDVVAVAPTAAASLQAYLDIPAVRSHHVAATGPAGWAPVGKP